MNNMTERDQIDLYKRIISGQLVPECAIDAFLCRPHSMQPKSQEQFLQQKEQLFKLRQQNMKKQETAQQQFTNLSRNDAFYKYSGKHNLSDYDFEELSKIVIEKGSIPCVYRAVLWPRLAVSEFTGNVEEFFTFLCTPAFQKFTQSNNIIGLKMQQCCDGEDSQHSVSTTEFTKQQINAANQQSNAIDFVVQNKLILNDINRTLSKTALFGESQPLFPTLCELVSCAVVRYNRYVQGLSVGCAVCLLYCSNKHDALNLLFKLTQSKIYQQFLQMNAESLQTYSQSIYKMVHIIFQKKEIQQKFKIKQLNTDELNENVFQVMCASTTGLVLSCFGKAGPEFASMCVDYLCFVDNGKQLYKRFIMLLVCFYCVKFMQYYKAKDIDLLLGELTKQISFSDSEMDQLIQLMQIVNDKDWLNESIMVMEEILRFVTD